MKTKTISSFFFFYFISLFGFYILGGTPIPSVMQWATHVDITETATISGVGSEDWCFSIKKSLDGGYIACGYSQIYNGTSCPKKGYIIEYILNSNINSINL